MEKLKDLAKIGNSQLGSWGEYVYQTVMQAHHLQVEVARIREHDFKVRNIDTGQEWKVDVKTTRKLRFEYKGARVDKSIVYDSVTVNEQGVFIYPATGSPLREIVYGNVGDWKNWLTKWQMARKARPQQNGPMANNLTKEDRQLLKGKLQWILKEKGWLKPRIVLRGAVSKTRWRDNPDNVPGSERDLLRHDLTLFVQLENAGDREVVSKMLALPHKRILCFPTINSSARQRNKGIDRVLDVIAFERQFPELVFYDEKSLYRLLPCESP